MLKIQSLNVKPCYKIFNQSNKLNLSKNLSVVNNSSKTNMLSKSLIALAVIATSTLQNCVIKEDLNPVTSFENIEEDSLDEQNTMQIFNLILNELGLIKYPAKDINDIDNFSFTSNENEDFYFEPISLKNNEIKIKYIKINLGILAEDAILTFANFDKGLRCENVSENNKSVSYFYKEDNQIVEYKDSKNLLVEYSRLFKDEHGTIVQKFTDGTIRTYSYISNNEGMPKEISFNPSVEDWK